MVMRMNPGFRFPPQTPDWIDARYLTATKQQGHKRQPDTCQHERKSTASQGDQPLHKYNVMKRTVVTLRKGRAPGRRCPAARLARARAEPPRKSPITTISTPMIANCSSRQGVSSRVNESRFWIGWLGTSEGLRQQQLDNDLTSLVSTT